ncbi:hypothetical protein [uncultured Devosia sp.]|uniref:hypothetical protein n=1 Tax=uncultured Devosia sp. TaxID=211434 RepID=UPI0035CC79A3
MDPREWRQALSERIERQAAVLSALIEALDVMEGDADLEPCLGAPEAQTGRGFWGAERTEEGSQLYWAEGSDADVEEENEHGGDVQDEPHDYMDEGNGDYCLADEMPDRGGMSDDQKDAALEESERLIAQARAMLPPPTILSFPGGRYS